MYQSTASTISRLTMACHTSAQTPAPVSVRINPTTPPTSTPPMDRSASGWNNMSRLVAAVGAAVSALTAGSNAIQREIRTNSGSPNHTAICGAARYTPAPSSRARPTFTVVMVSKCS